MSKAGAHEGLEPLQAMLIAAFPELAASRFTVMTKGWDSLAVDVDGRLIFKFPRDETAAKALRREAALLARIRPALTMAVPDLTLHEEPMLFSRHDKLPGDHLTAADYRRLPEEARNRLAADLALFYAQLHALDMPGMAEAGARPVEVWGHPDDILPRALAVLPAEFHPFAERTVAAWRALPPDPHGVTYGFFDGHGWNMAFDHEAGRLRGIYDFADSGFGPLHQEFIYSNFIDADLTARIAGHYEALTGRALDRRRIAVLTGAHRLWEFAGPSAGTEHLPEMIEHLASWVATESG